MSVSENKRQKLLKICRRQIKLEEVKYMEYKGKLSNISDSNSDMTKTIIEVFYLIPIDMKLKYLKQTLECIQKE